VSDTTPVPFGNVAGASPRLQSAIRNIPTSRLKVEKMSSPDTTRSAAPWSAIYSDYGSDQSYGQLGGVPAGIE
jgi:hypothetical protein